MEALTLAPHHALVASDQVAPEAMRDFFDRYYPMLGEFLGSVGASPLAARAYYFSPPGEVFDLAAGFVVPAGDLAVISPLVGDIGDERVTLRAFDSMDVLTHRVTAPYEELGARWESFSRDALTAGHSFAGLTFEEYVTMPGGEEAPVTDLYIALS
ncbi:hypothetical protein [Corynebacterium liangguodongii]|uniref:Uncharacterized protein n=1 Tax=Corynebacterium liangguodongii TaxID=2079535 RepID=A0A2S0WD62_9CORY|nr:hypothetical protein [Corynebacterium liangguodongii]AWB83684.1 hypothetical protein C3E79_03605 [Corynebacterium liangguodongii]PWB99506.1 hypothetical protein DF219_06190 [Corynebacterium liangguodongii]